MKFSTVGLAVAWLAMAGTAAAADSQPTRSCQQVENERVRVVRIAYGALPMSPDEAEPLHDVAIPKFDPRGPYDEQVQKIYDLASLKAQEIRDCVNGVLGDPGRAPGRPVLARVMRENLAEAGAALETLRALVRQPSLFGAPIAETTGLKGKLASLETEYRQAAQRTAMLSNQYGFYAGLAYSLDAAGSLIPGAELQFRFDNQASSPAGLCPAWMGLLWCRRFSEFSYQNIPAIDVEQVTSATPGAAEGGLPGLPGAGATVANAARPSNPFIDAGGYVRLNTGVKAHVEDWIGFAFGAGLSSQPGDLNGKMRFKPRGFIGLSTLTMHGDGAQSQLIVAYAYDKFWQREQYRNPLNPAAGVETIEEFDRVVVDGLLMIPGVRPAGFSVAVRLWVDTPADFGDGPSEARASILFYQDFSGWTKLFDPVRSLTTPITGVLGL